ncbi:hypothetical protein GGR52DRAFT_580911 [Hypoxylon sp. FL1284]|nr:hypothetical protein GGR52DRAFT_580911 [Hypoxylon sp. FL1284]
MDLGRGTLSSTNVSSTSRADPAEYDEIPLDSTSEESKSHTNGSVSGSDDDEETEARRGPLAPASSRHMPTQPRSSPGAARVHAPQRDQNLPRKRKLEGAADTTASYATVPAKKVKIGKEDTPCRSDKSLTPPEIWHRVFTFTPPGTLGKLLRVNKLFNAYLDPLSCYRRGSSPPILQTSAAALKPDAIWQLSRRRFWPRMPAPLMLKTELDMWRLVCGKTCQFCGGSNLISSRSPRAQRHERARHIWAFALRSCGPCLVERTVKEFDLLLSSSVPSVLISALPFALTTSETHTVSPDALQRGLVPPDVQITKVYLSEHVDRLKQECLSVKSMGEATVEEWLKGLEFRGKEFLSDSMRWEKWASSGGVAQLSYDSIPRTNRSIENDFMNQQHSRQQGIHSNAPRVRTHEEALELKAARRMEIERRAMELDPPLAPNVLALIPSFQAAIQIISPLDDNAWNLLKPRLLSQRRDAEAEAEQGEPTGRCGTSQSRSVPEKAEQHLHEEGNTIATKQLIDKTWDDVQAPLRARISAYADELIRDDWGNGHKVDIENSPQFAAEVLLHVRKRFRIEIAEEFTAARAAGQSPVQDPPDGPFTQKLTLENMRWLFDVKVKSHTESYRKDLFFCNGCEVNFKAYGFEGVIQHYAAKHTTALSKGSVVVYWRAEWPDIPPFKPNPKDTKIQGPSEHLHDASRSQNHARSRRHNYNSYPSFSHIASSLPGPPVGRGHPGHDPLPQPPIPYGQIHFSAHGQHDYSSPHHLLPYTYATTHPTYEVGQPGLPEPHSPEVYSMSPTSYPSVAIWYSGPDFSAYQANSQRDPYSSYDVSLANKYRVQLEYLAKSSRELWTAIAGLKELPGSLRISIVIHHTVQQFRSRFSESPPLAMFIDGLSNSREMRPVRNINGLICKACHLRLGPGATADRDCRTFSLPKLVNHFQQKHVDQLQSIGMPILDWAVHMVHTPDLSVLSHLRHLANMDDQKFSLISDAFPPAQYAASYPQGDSTSSNQGGWANVGMPVPPYFRGHAAYNASIQDSSQYDTSSRQPIAKYGIGELYSHDPAQSPTLRPNLDMRQSTGAGNPPPRTRQIPQQGGMERSSSEVRAGPNGIKLKKRKGNHNLDSQNLSRQSFRNRKGGERVATTESKSQEPNQENLLSEEERRQEEEIRAMWAADRVGAARFASGSQGAVEEGGRSKVRPGDKHPTSSRTRMVQASEPSPYPTHAESDQHTDTMSDCEEDDLMAGLESQLDRMPSKLIDHDQQCRLKHIYLHKGRPFDEGSPNSSVYIRHEARPHGDRRRDGSPISGPVTDPFHEPIHAMATSGNVLRGQVRQQPRQAFIHHSRSDTSDSSMTGARSHT